MQRIQFEAYLRVPGLLWKGLYKTFLEYLEAQSEKIWGPKTYRYALTVRSLFIHLRIADKNRKRNEDKKFYSICKEIREIYYGEIYQTVWEMSFLLRNYIILISGLGQKVILLAENNFLSHDTHWTVQTVYSLRYHQNRTVL